MICLRLEHWHYRGSKPWSRKPEHSYSQFIQTKKKIIETVLSPETKRGACGRDWPLRKIGVVPCCCCGCCCCCCCCCSCKGLTTWPSCWPRASWSADSLVRREFWIKIQSINIIIIIIIAQTNFFFENCWRFRTTNSHICEENNNWNSCPIFAILATEGLSIVWLYMELLSISIPFK